MRLILAIIALSLIGCGGLKKRKQVKVSERDSSAQTETVIKETVDTVIQVTGGTITGSKPAENILAGDSLVVESGDQIVTVKYDKVTKNIKANAVLKPKSVTVKIDREVRQKTSVRVKEKQKETVKEVEKGWPWGAILICLLILITLFWIIRDKFKFLK